MAALEPQIVAPTPVWAERPRRDALPPAMGLGRGTDEVLEQQAAAENDCGLRAQFFALFGATCKKR